MTNLTRVQSPGQILEVVDLAREIWTEHYVPIIGQAQVDYMLGRYQSEKAISEQLAEGVEYYMVSHHGKTVGYLAVVPDAGAETLMISKLYVRGSERGQGFGRTMLEFAENLCRERRIRTLWLTVNRNNTDSVAWYLRRGFTNAGPSLQDIGSGFVMDDHRMEKALG